MAQLPMKSGAAVRAHAIMYKAVVQTVLMYGSEIWVVTGDMLTVLEGFHHQVTRLIVVKKAWSDGDGGWEWPPTEEALEVTGLWTTK